MRAIDWGAKHLSELITLEEEGVLEVSGVADIAYERLQLPALKTGKLTRNHEKLLGDSDAAIIATPPETHIDIALKWISEGKHLLVEKPVATSYVDALKLMVRAIDNQVCVMPGHIYRFSRLVKEIRRVYESGELGGSVKGVNMRFITPSAPKGDPYWDLLPHCLDVCHSIFDSLPSKKQGHGFFDGRCFSLLYEYNKPHMNPGFQVRIEVGFLPQKHRSIEILGDQKWLSTDVVATFQHYYITDPKTGARTEHWVPPNNTLQDEIRAFVRNIEQKEVGNEYLQAAVDGIKLIESPILPI